jgi:hypothetical protein
MSSRRLLLAWAGGQGSGHLDRAHHLAGSAGRSGQGQLRSLHNTVVPHWNAGWSQRFSASTSGTTSAPKARCLVSCLSGYNTMRYPFKADFDIIPCSSGLSTILSTVDSKYASSQDVQVLLRR